MAAPERFAETSDSSCTAGAVHTWPFATNYTLGPDVSFRSDAEVGRALTTSLCRRGQLWVIFDRGSEL